MDGVSQIGLCGQHDSCMLLTAGCFFTSAVRQEVFAGVDGRRRGGGSTVHPAGGHSSSAGDAAQQPHAARRASSGCFCAGDGAAGCQPVHGPQRSTAPRLVSRRLPGVHASLSPARLDARVPRQATWRDTLSCRQQAHCQPNFRHNVVPDPAVSCGPYRPAPADSRAALAAPACSSQHVRRDNHDTIAMIAVDAAGNIGAGASSNGASHKASSSCRVLLPCWLAAYICAPVDAMHQRWSLVMAGVVLLPSRCRAGLVTQQFRAAAHMPTAQWARAAPQATATSTCASCHATR
jgi:Asparaginase